MKPYTFGSNSRKVQRVSTKASKVDLLKGDDFKCALMGSLGFSTRLIMRHTDLTPSQIGYRLRKAEVRRSDYRNGESTLATSMLKRARVIAISDVKAHLRQVIAESKNKPMK